MSKKIIAPVPRKGLLEQLKDSELHHYEEMTKKSLEDVASALGIPKDKLGKADK